MPQAYRVPGPPLTTRLTRAASRGLRVVLNTRRPVPMWWMMPRMGGRRDQDRAYRIVVAVAAPIMWRWSRMTVRGVELIPETGPLLVVADHDSYWDPMAI